MPNISDQTVQAGKEWWQKRQQAEFFLGYPGIIDDDDNTIQYDVPGKPGMVWVRLWSGDESDAGATPVEATNFGAVLHYEMLVLLIRIFGEYVIWMPDPKSARELYGTDAPGAATPPAKKSIKGGNADLIEDRQLLMGLVYPGANSDLNITIYDLPYEGGFWQRDEVSVAAYVPGTVDTKYWLIVGIDMLTGDPFFIPTSEVGIGLNPMPRGEVYVTEIPASHIPLHAVLLKYGQTAITTSTEMIDLRWWASGVTRWYNTIYEDSVALTRRGGLNLVPGENVYFNITDDVGNDITEVVINSASASGSYAGYQQGYISVKETDSSPSIGFAAEIRFNSVDFVVTNPSTGVAQVSRLVSSIYRNPIDRPKASADTPDDDFTAATLDAKWTAVAGSLSTVSLLGSGGSIYDLTTRPGDLLCQVSNTNHVKLRQDYTLPDGSSIIMAFTASVPATISDNELQIFLSLNDNNTDKEAGNSFSVFMDTDSLTWQIQSRANGAGGAALSDFNPPLGGTVYLRITRAGLVYTSFYSLNGDVWINASTQTPAGAYDNIWITVECLAASGPPTGISAIHWIRQGSNALDPWAF